MKKRTLAKTLLSASRSFPVLLITGPRQVGKTTLLELCATQKRHYVTLDDWQERELAERDPALFLQKHGWPLTIDEVQYAPKLFSSIKMLVDREKKPGMVWLTGSQKFHLMHGITESLAGRVAILDLLGLSREEIRDTPTHASHPFLPSAQWVQKRRKTHEPATLMGVYRAIWRGSFPKLLTDSKTSRDVFFNSYVKTYLERDVQDLIQVRDHLTFRNFLRAAAARTGQLINYADIARDVGVDQKTVKAWLSILETSGLIYLLPPYHNNVSKRLVKMPKLYFLDTGLCSFLMQWPSPEALEAGALSGAILETYLFTEILKSYWHRGLAFNAFYYRDTNQKEIDLLLEQGDTLYPIEFKKTASPSPSLAKIFASLSALKRTIGHGIVFCFRETDLPLSPTTDAVPIAYL